MRDRFKTAFLVLLHNYTLVAAKQFIYKNTFYISKCLATMMYMHIF